MFPYILTCGSAIGNGSQKKKDVSGNGDRTIQKGQTKKKFTEIVTSSDLAVFPRNDLK